MLTHKRIVVTSLAILIISASLMFISPVKAVTYFAEMPPYTDKSAMSEGSNYPDAKANITDGHLQVLCIPLINEVAAGIAEVWSTFHCPAGVEITIEYSYKIKGWVKCAGLNSVVGAKFWLFVEKPNGEVIKTETLFNCSYVNYGWQSVNDMSTGTFTITIPESGYYRFGASLFGGCHAGVGFAVCDFYTQDDGA